MTISCLGTWLFWGFHYLVKVVLKAALAILKSSWSSSISKALGGSYYITYLYLNCSDLSISLSLH